MTRVSTYGNYQTALLDLMSAQSRMADAQQKVNTKKNATDLVGFGRGSETVSALMTSQTRIQTFIDTNKTVTARLETQDLAMDRVADASTAARQAIADAIAAERTHLNLFERALELWPQVDDPDVVAGVSHAALVEETAMLAVDAGELRQRQFAERDEILHFDADAVADEGLLRKIIG